MVGRDDRSFCCIQKQRSFIFVWRLIGIDRFLLLSVGWPDSGAGADSSVFSFTTGVSLFLSPRTSLKSSIWLIVFLCISVCAFLCSC